MSPPSASVRYDDEHLLYIPHGCGWTQLVNWWTKMHAGAPGIKQLQRSGFLNLIWLPFVGGQVSRYMDEDLIEDACRGTAFTVLLSRNATYCTRVHKPLKSD